jgi:hypothetical protein
MIDKIRIDRVAKQWLAPLDLAIADLLDKSSTMTAGAFARELEDQIAKIPQMFDKLDRNALAEDLEDAIGEAVIIGMDGKGGPT